MPENYPSTPTKRRRSYLEENSFEKLFEALIENFNNFVTRAFFGKKIYSPFSSFEKLKASSVTKVVPLII